MFRVRQLTNRWAGSWKPHHRKSYWSVPVFVAIHLSLFCSFLLFLFFHSLALFISILSCSFPLVSTFWSLPSALRLLSPTFLHSDIHFVFLLCFCLCHLIFYLNDRVTLSLPPQSVFFLHTSSSWNFVIDSLMWALWACFWFMNEDDGFFFFFCLKSCAKGRENRPHSSTQTCVNKHVFQQATSEPRCLSVRTSSDIFVCCVINNEQAWEVFCYSTVEPHNSMELNNQMNSDNERKSLTTKLSLKRVTGGLLTVMKTAERCEKKNKKMLSHSTLWLLWSQFYWE